MTTIAPGASEMAEEILLKRQTVIDDILHCI